jgi:pimeloyl-ACP methyl ester carboxylesterase
MDLHYQSVGQGTPVIFIHGFSLDSRMWQPQIDYFSKTNQVISYDMRGYGQSPMPIKPYSHVEDLHTLLSELNIEKAHIIALSLGGETATEYTLTYPNTALSLTLADTSLGGYSSKIDWRVYAKEQGLEHAKQNWLNHAVFAPSNRKPEVAKQLKEMVDDYTGWHWVNYDPRIKLEPPAIDRLGEIKVPTQVILGELDLPYYHDIAKILTDKIPNSNLHVIKDSGHMTNLENAVKFNEIVDSFINQ